MNHTEIRVGLLLDQPSQAASLDGFAEALSRALGSRVSVTALPTHPSLHTAFEQRLVNVLWAPPMLAHELLARREATALAAVVRGGKTSYPAVLVVRRGGAVRVMTDLHGARMCWGPKLSMAGFVVPRLFLEAEGHAIASMFAAEQHATTHQCAVQALLRGEVDVAATYARFKPCSAGIEPWLPSPEIRVLAVTGRVPSELLVAATSVDPFTRARLAAALARLDESALKGPRALFGCDGLVTAEADHMGALRRLVSRARVASSERPPTSAATPRAIA